MRLCSHTIVKNGMPFIIPILEQVAPYIDKYFIALSEFSDDGTIEALQNWNAPKPVEFMMEGSKPKALTKIRQFQVDRTTQDWILFLDDDDWWIPEKLEHALKIAESGVDAVAVSPYQILDKEHYDSWWGEKKWFTKLFKNEDINYRGDWPKDMIYKGDKMLYHKTYPYMGKVPYGYFHLSEVKPYSFRHADPRWWNDVKSKKKFLSPLPEELARLL